MLTRLRSMSREEMAALPDLSEGLENRLYGAVRRSCTVNELLEELKTKRYSHARLRRLLMSAFLGIPKDFCRISPPYLRVLGFNERGLEILREAKKKASLPLSHSLAELERAGETAARLCRFGGPLQLICTICSPVAPALRIGLYPSCYSGIARVSLVPQLMRIYNKG